MNSKRNAHGVRRVTKRLREEWAWGALFISPWLIGVSVFFVYAMVRSLNFAFSEVVLDGGLVLNPLDQLLGNFKTVIFTELNLVFLFGEYLSDTLTRLAIIIPFSLIIAMMLNTNIKGRLFFRLIFFFPVVIASGPVMDKLIAQGAASLPLISRQTLMVVLSALPDNISAPILELFSSLVLILWQSGIQILIFLAGLQKVSGALYEAARIDGATIWETFWQITIPSLKPLILLNMLYSIVTLSSDGSNGIITKINSLVTQAENGYGLSAALAWMYTLVVSLLIVLSYLLLREKSDKHVRYETKRIKGGNVL